MNRDKVSAFTQKIFSDMAGSMIAGLCYVGLKTGLFQLMAYKGPLTLDQIVDQSKLHARYVEEWLKGLVCGGYLEYDPKALTYHLPDEHAYLLSSEGTDHFAGGLFQMVPASLSVAPKVAEAFKTGGGVSFQDYPEELVEAIDLINRGNYEHRLTNYWLKALPNTLQRLETGAYALDIGCGVGKVTLTLAQAFPKSRFVGVDCHAKSVDQANSTAKMQDLASRVQFSTQPLDKLNSNESFDLITACDCLHDFNNPIEMLHQIRKCLKTDGTLFIIEPKVADNLEANCNSIATMFFGFSLFHCMTQSLAEGGPGLGTCMGPKKTEQLVREAGYSHFERLNIKSQVNLFYAAKP